MAFSATEKTKMLYYLGYSVFEDDGPAMRAINSLDAKEPVAGSIIRGILERLDKLQCEIQEVSLLSVAIQDGSIQLRADYTLSVLWKMARSQVNQLARFTKTSINGDIFAAGSNARDAGDFYSGDPSENRIDSSLGTTTKESGGGY